MPVVEVVRSVRVRMDQGRVVVALEPGRHTVTQDAAERLVAGGFARLVVPRGRRFANDSTEATGT